YDEALKLIQLDKKERLQMLSQVEKELALESLRYDLLVKSELNDPEVQKNFKLGKIDMGRPVYRYMRQREFQKAPRAKLMERITQMNVIPDVLAPGLSPEVDISIQLAGEQSAVEPGVFVQPEQTIEKPSIQVTNFHTDTRLYTLMLVDPDSPDVVNQTYQQHCHWLIANVPLSATEPVVNEGDSVLDYVPPHPQKGTKYHRYTLVAFEQPKNGQEKVDIKVSGRDHFDVKALAETYNLSVSGASFFRQEWNPTVSKIYEEVLGTQEPVYGKPPKIQNYIKRTTYF
ncbi:phosphatidylethanolamine-binding protein, partial [Phycomyces nitens]